MPIICKPGDRGRVLELLERMSANTLMKTLAIRYTDVGEDFLEATMPVGPTVHQPMGILHGGATAALAESVASAASGIVLHGSGSQPVGLELAINHIKALREGSVTARAQPIHLGSSTHLWQIDIRDHGGERVALAKLTMIVLRERS